MHDMLAKEEDHKEHGHREVDQDGHQPFAKDLGLPLVYGAERWPLKVFKNAKTEDRQPYTTVYP